MTAEGKVLRAGRSIVFCEAEVRAADGALVARASGLFKPVAAKGDG
jgi:acyl-coenzyme A thioesterase PaaI-like protein